eukprot:gene4157-5203_t
MSNHQQVGGIGSVHPADKEIQDIVDKIRSKVQEKLHLGTIQQFRAISYKKQLVNGFNYFVKVQCDNQVIHLRIYQDFKATETKLVSIQENKSLHDDITYF